MSQIIKKSRNLLRKNDKSEASVLDALTLSVQGLYIYVDVSDKVKCSRRLKDGQYRRQPGRRYVARHKVCRCSLSVENRPENVQYCRDPPANVVTWRWKNIPEEHKTGMSQVYLPSHICDDNNNLLVCHSIFVLLKQIFLFSKIL